MASSKSPYLKFKDQSFFSLIQEEGISLFLQINIILDWFCEISIIYDIYIPPELHIIQVNHHLDDTVIIQINENSRIQVPFLFLLLSLTFHSVQY
ncbi:unnamed protein product (macronuclear) [Paramecium tetraurelia]|uniref:Uncharacterized protein n=1 Tax=Paramecium tetraurelia TaxID=5888 RepID=A0BTQ2_PARTE|nr:uncharacterized protein GSPATT00032151001 [Paramecium tetraurelia]CAK61919.1 unnamed protein product [Paramecium tetraurelia]|eukprot:XP_001429317.1 hypothetical protein (macronuclear) [Paramecium tetraurelia strain d4-2]